ncbi:ATP-dependent nuclease [Lichenihabitans psoromatis]|uniref:ATP-dependent nuclease n=1 Tax=Lichenihabitans psoromatis TaxID=2528642 RepID=UPI001036BAD6|nr:ATP-binding protein [Lichenihabitans psoromatis]
MARVRHINVRNFRCIQQLSWTPSVGINCLIGPGDSGKSTILDAIDLCLGARRSLTFTDADFYQLNVTDPIVITATVGELDDTLKSMESYGNYLRSFNASSGVVEDEPEAQAETVLSIRLTVGSDLDPVWTLVSDRAEAAGQSRFLTWADRARLAPNRVGALADHNLAWRRGSVLNRLSDERPEMAAALADAARNARAAFGDLAENQLGGTLRIVEATAQSLGITVGEGLKALLDTHSVTFNGGSIALHGADGVPLRALGIGSTRLLLAGLQRQAAREATVVLIDELEHGLEPHRILRLLGSIGAKDAEPPLQAFITTHSPVAVRELGGDQLFVVRNVDGRHHATSVGVDEHVQGTIRLYPEAFLAPSVIICEGASEVGFVRGMDLIGPHRVVRVDC